MDTKVGLLFAEGGGGGGRKSGARKGQFAKSKGHHGRGGQNENQEHLNMDVSTHMLFPGIIFLTSFQNLLYCQNEQNWKLFSFCA